MIHRPPTTKLYAYTPLFSSISGQIPDMEIAARLAKVTALIISRDVVIDYALYGTPELALVANNKAEILQFRGR